MIPTNIFQTWHTKSLPPLMARAVNKVRRMNPRFNYQLFDDNDCREFIQTNFPNETGVLHAFDNLVPGAYKADLWRYCVLYKKGGIYIDIKYIPINEFRCIALTEREHFCLDADGHCIYNAVMVAAAGNPMLLKAIRKIVENVKNKFYGGGILDPTGPRLLENIFTQEDRNKVDLTHCYYFSSFSNRFVKWNEYHIFKSYNGYMEESRKYAKVGYYGNLWTRRMIYK